MRTIKPILLMVILLTISFTMVALQVRRTSYKQPMSQRICHHIKNDNPNFDNPVIIWNDDHEGLPRENSLIVLEFYSNDTIYIGHYDPNKTYNKD